MDTWDTVWNMLSSVGKLIIAIVAIINLIDRKAHDKRRSKGQNGKRRLPKHKR